MNTLNTFDYLILGGGLGGLSMAALLAKDGHSVCVLEGNNVVGGYAHTLKKGKYAFCHEVQYLTGCGKDGPTHCFLKKLGLDKDVLFNSLDSKSFDVVSILNTKFDIPHGVNNFEKKLIAAFPDSEEKLRKYFFILEKLCNEAEAYEKVITKWDILCHPFRHRHLLKYRKYTLHQFFQELDFPLELRAILAGQAGNLAAPPECVSLLIHAAMQVMFCKGAYFPKKGMEHFINKIAEFITEHNGKIITNCLVKKLHTTKKKIVNVETSQGTYFGETIISNIDPHRTMELIGMKNVSSKYRKKMQYEYSNSVFTIYLGLKGIDLKNLGFGKRNIWHHSHFLIEKEFRDEIKNNDFSHPWLFISTPSMNADEGILCPKGSHTMEILTFVNYEYFRHLFDNDRNKFRRVKNQLEKHILDIIEESYVPNLRKYIDAKITHTPIDVEKILHAPKGNVYGASLTPSNYKLDRITQHTPFDNLYFVGATSSYPGTMGVILGSLDLHKHLCLSYQRSFSTHKARADILHLQASPYV